jgi:hypothetical protein
LSTYRGAKCPKPAHIVANTLETFIRDTLRGWLAGATAIVSEPDTAALTFAERALNETEAELDAFAVDMKSRRALGDRYHEHLALRVDAVETSRKAYRGLAQNTATALTIHAADIIYGQDVALFSELLRGIVLSRSSSRPETMSSTSRASCACEIPTCACAIPAAHAATADAYSHDSRIASSGHHRSRSPREENSHPANVADSPRRGTSPPGSHLPEASRIAFVARDRDRGGRSQRRVREPRGSVRSSWLRY